MMVKKKPLTRWIVFLYSRSLLVDVDVFVFVAYPSVSNTRNMAFTISGAR